MAITRWDPWHDVMQNRMNSFFQELSRNQTDNDQPATAVGFVPPADIYENEHQIVLKLEIPGIRQEDLDIQVENDTLSVRGERSFEKEEKEENFRRVERRYGSFYRAFTLPNTVDADKIQASYENGVLKLTLEKRAEAKPKQIKISVGQTGGSKQIESKKPSKEAAA
jgi:HSP20 family protein